MSVREGQVDLDVQRPSNQSPPMYKIVGADGREYGPISLEQLRQWIAEGRANALTRVLPEGATEWKTLSELPEFAGTFVPGPGATPPGPTAPPEGPPPFSTTPTPLAPGGFSGRPDPLSQVNAPAVGLIVVAILNFLASAISLVMHLAGASFMNAPGMEEAWARMFTGTIGLISNIINVGIGVLILIGGLKMKKLESFGLAVTACILAILPCTSPCCLIGLPIGIWALVVLFRPEVKSAFR